MEQAQAMCTLAFSVVRACSSLGGARWNCMQQQGCMVYGAV
jgi:hypothetical protein